MSGVHKSLNKVVPKEDWLLRANPIIKKINKENLRTHSSLSGAFNPKFPDVEIPAAPTIDDAQRNRDQQDRLRRRRGVLANIYGGGGSSGGSATLGGG